MKKILTGLLSVFAGTMALHAQTLISAGKMEGGLPGTAHITATNTMGYGMYMAGWFTDSLDLDPDPAAVNNVFGSGNKNAFIAYYPGTGLYSWSISLTDPALDSCIINDMYFDPGGYLYIIGAFSGTIDFDPSASTAAASSSTYTGFIAKYDNINGNYLGHYLLDDGVTGSSCPTSIIIAGGSQFLLGGWFEGTIDMDPSGGTAILTSTGGKDAFFAKYSFSMSYSGYGQKLPSTGSGNEMVTKVGYDDGLCVILGTFDNNIDLNPAGSTTNNTNGGTDIFVGQYDFSLNYNTGFTMGGTGNDKPFGFYKKAIAIEFENVIDINPLGTSTTLTSAGSTDLAVLRYDGFYNIFNYSSYGNSGPNKGLFFNRESAEPSFYLGTSFSGSINIGGKTLTAANNPVNGLIIETTEMADYVTCYHVEAQKCSGIVEAGFSENEMFIVGEFTGTNVDVMPATPEHDLTSASANALFFVHYNRCDLEGEIVMPNTYPCGTCEASLTFVATGGAGNITGSWYPDFESATTIFNKCPGEYSGMFSDFHACMVEDTFEIYTHPTGFELAADITPVNSSCNNNYGSATAVVSNALGDVLYHWSNGDTTAAADSLFAGIYTATISDSINCHVSQTVIISDTDGPSITLSDTTGAGCSGVTTGAIDITITGGAAPLDILWSNGQTTEDLTGIAGGTYAVLVTDANGCQAQMCISLPVPTALGLVLTDTTSISTCGGNNGTIMVTATGGTEPYAFAWDAAAGSVANDTVSNLAVGVYELTVTDAAGCNSSAFFAVSETGGPGLYVSYDFDVSCSAGPGYVDIDYSSPNTVSALWNTGETFMERNIETAGTYWITGTDDVTGCKSILVYTAEQYLPNTPDICMVTVDSTGTKNVIVWDKTTTPDGEYYKIYREGFCSSTDFLPIGMVDHDSLSIFEDTVVNTETRSWRYYVTVVDTCGFESLPSQVNKTIHLTATFTPTFEVLLNWEAYIGREIAQYEIFRNTDTDSTVFVQIDSVGGLITTYLDTDDLGTYNFDVEYYVEAVPVNPCYASRAFNQNASRSNHSRVGLAAIPNDTSSVGDLNIEQLIQVYPNPANDRVTIRVSGTDVSFDAVLMNQVGQVMKTFEVNRNTSISTRELQQGIYYLRLTGTDQQNKTFKLVIAH